METTKVDILAFGAHPDDVECSAAGVILKHIAMGRTVAIADLTAGETGNYGDAESRKNEGEFIRSTVMIFQEDFEKFFTALDRVKAEM